MGITVIYRHLGIYIGMAIKLSRLLTGIVVGVVKSNLPLLPYIEPA